MDSRLVVRAQQGDREAFTGIVDAIGGRLHAIAYTVLRDRDLARDATQQTLLTAWQDLPHPRTALPRGEPQGPSLDPRIG